MGPAVVHVVGPGYLADIPGGGLYPAGLADLIAGVVDRYTGVRLAAPALVQLKANAPDWLREWMGFRPLGCATVGRVPQIMLTNPHVKRIPGHGSRPAVRVVKLRQRVALRGPDGVHRR